MGDVKSIMIVGVGGQGTLLASRVMGNVLMRQGYDVKLSEVHGMAQRGGSVVTYVKYGDHVYSPVIEKGEADLIVSFELCEAARYLPYLKKGGKIVVNDQKIPPMPVITDAAEYPEDIVERIRRLGVEVVCADALSLAEQAGSPKAVNIVLIGVLSQMTDIPLDAWEAALEQSVPPKFLELNRRAFRLGREIAVK